MSDAIPHPLKHPVEIKNTGGEVVEVITELQLHRFSGADVRKVMNAKAKGEGEMIATMIVCSARIPPSTFDKLDGEDVTDAGAVVAGFIGASLPTGPT